MAPYRAAAAAPAANGTSTKTAVNTAANTAGYTDAQKRIAELYGVSFDGSGTMQKGSATDLGYRQADVDYQTDLQKQQIGVMQEQADAEHKASLEAYRAYADRQNEKLGVAREQSRREAAVAMEKLSRYLPYVHRKAGTVGSGVSETTSLAQYNAALSRMAEADRDYRAGVQDVEDDYLESKRALDAAKLQGDTDRRLAGLQLDAAAGTSKLSLYDTARQESRADSEAMFTAVDDDLGVAFESMAGEDGKISPAEMEELRAYADKYRGDLGAAEQKYLDMILRGYERAVRSEAEQSYWDASNRVFETGMYANSNNNSIKIGRNMWISDGKGGKAYEAQVAEIVEDEAVLQKATSVADGEVFAIGDTLYAKTKGSSNVIGGQIVRLEGRTLSDRSYRKLLNLVKDKRKNSGSGGQIEELKK